MIYYTETLLEDNKHTVSKMLYNSKFAVQLIIHCTAIKLAS